MYSAQALADGKYEASDLPDAVTISGVSYSRSGTSYGNTTNGVIFEEDVWAKYTNGTRSERPCLIQGGVEDQFADSYTLDASIGDLVGGGTVTRISLCRWEGTDACGNKLYLHYGDSIEVPFGENYKWTAIANVYQEGCGFDANFISLKDDPQNSPIGLYIGGIGDITVS
jgi:hypothetical protein